MFISYSQDHPAIPSQDHSSSSNRPFIPLSHGSLLQSPRRVFPAPDEPSSPDQPSLSTRSSILSNTCSDSVSSKHSFSEDLNNYPPTPTFSLASRSNSLVSDSLDYNQPISPPLLTRAPELGSARGRDHNSSSDHLLSEHSFREDLNSSVSGQPPTPPAYTPVRPSRDSLSLPIPPSAPISAVTQALGRRNSVSVVEAPAPLRRATNPLPIVIPLAPTASRRSPESSPRGQVSTGVRLNDESLIRPSPIPMHDRREGWYNRRGYALRV